ncbi:hypothetical protein FXO37_09081 [Capsicum annuum]|nr:hypothetical protein FXO37_09081 [Capsicum annuum]
MSKHANCSMNFDEIPSFSLGSTQDENINLVSCNNQSKRSLNLQELRSKKRNDPQKSVEIMKRKAMRESFRCIYVYDSLSSAGHDSAVLAEVEKLAEVIPYCLLSCKFYEKKGIDIDNHPNYKLNDKHDLFYVYIMEDLPQQPCGGLDCGLYMITYAECLTFGGSVPKVDFDLDLLRTRYASILWHYGTKKQEEKAQSDDEAPSRPRREIQLTEVTEVHDI